MKKRGISIYLYINKLLIILLLSSYTQKSCAALCEKRKKESVCDCESTRDGLGILSGNYELRIYEGSCPLFRFTYSVFRITLYVISHIYKERVRACALIYKK